MSKRQERLLAFFASPTSYPHRPGDVRSLETHISWVFIASPFVYKVKKPVNLGFLDFSTLEKRHHFCQRELELNRRLCPEVYLAVIPIYEGDRGFSFDDAVGEIARVRGQDAGAAARLVPERTARKTRGRRNGDQPRHLSSASFYESETPRPEIEEWGRSEKLKISTDENFAQVKPFVGKTLSRARLRCDPPFHQQILRRQREAIRTNAFSSSRIRDCHGDLHLDHVHLTPEATTIFDCIEFNDRFRFIDIANDLAFLAMDFDFEGQHELGSLSSAKRGARISMTPGAEAGEFLQVLSRLRARQSGEPANDRLSCHGAEHSERAARYFHLALRYATLGSRPFVLVVMGRVGTGKSTVARQLARELDWPRLFLRRDSQNARRRAAQLGRTAPELRAKVYSEEMTDRTYRSWWNKDLPHSRPLAALFSTPHFRVAHKRDYLRDECAKAQVRLQVVELETRA